MFARLISRWLAVIVAAFVLLALAPAASALADRPVPTCFRHAAAGDAARALFDTPAAFTCHVSQRGQGAGDYWVIARSLPHAEGREVRVRTGSIWLDQVTLYVRYADGAIRSTGFTSADAWRHLKLGATFEWTVPDRAAPPVQLLWHVRGAINTRGVIINPRVVTAAESQRAEVTMAAFYAAMAGLCLTLLTSNLAMWAALRQKFHAPYCALVLCLLAYGVSSSGLLGQLTGMDNNLRQRLNLVLLALVMASAIGFARSFFESRVFDGWVRRAADIAVAGLLAIVTLNALLVPWQVATLDLLTSLAFAACVALVVPILARAWRLQRPYARIFAIAWGAPVAFAGIRIAHSLGLIGWTFWIDSSTLIAMVLEASLSALVIAWRIKLLVEERDAAREREVLARLLADSDPLTGLMNRRSFLREAIGRSEPQLLILLDIDHFKQVNDTLGHDGGDEVLRVFSQALQAASPAEALVARLGGEEFAVLAPAGCDDLPERLLAVVRGTPMPFDLAITASLGSGYGPLAGEGDWKRLYRRADDALYAAKSAGRDRARWAKAA